MLRPVNPAAGKKGGGKGTALPRVVPPKVGATVVGAPAAAKSTMMPSPRPAAPAKPASATAGPAPGEGQDTPRPQPAVVPAEGETKKASAPSPDASKAVRKASLTGPEPPVKGSSLRLTVDKFSLAPDSFWRPAQPGVVKQFEAVFLEQFGASILGGVKYRVQDTETWKPMVDSAGLFLGDDGGSTVRALQNLHAGLQAGHLARDQCCAQLLDVIDHGIWATPVFYASGDSLCHVAWNAAAHSEENMKWLATTVVDHVDLVKRLALMFQPATQWDDVRKYLLTLYGQGRRRSVARWVTAAKALPDTVVDAIRVRVAEKGIKHGVSDRFVLDNPYIVGHEVQAQWLLAPAAMISVFLQLFQALDQGIKVNVEDFQTVYCQPMKMLTTWFDRVERRWGEWGANAEAEPWKKLKASAQYDEGLRLGVVRCTRDAVVLDDATRGIPALREAIVSFKAAKAEEKARKHREKQAGLKEIEDRAKQIEAEAAEEAKRAAEEAEARAVEAKEEARTAAEKLNKQAELEEGSEGEQEPWQDLEVTVAAAPCGVGEDEEVADMLVSTHAQAEARRRAIAREKTDGTLEGVTFHDSLAAVGTVIKDRVEQKGPSTQVVVIVDTGSAAHSMMQETIDAVGAALRDIPDDVFPSVRVGICSGPLFSGTNVAVNRVLSSFPPAAVYETKLASSENRAVPLYGSGSRAGKHGKGVPREGTNEWMVTAVMPPPQYSKRRKGTRGFGTVSMPFMISTMPKRALNQDQTLAVCRGGCAFYKGWDEMSPDTRESSMKAQQPPPESRAMEAMAQLIGQEDSSSSEDSDDSDGEAVRKKAEKVAKKAADAAAAAAAAGQQGEAGTTPPPVAVAEDPKEHKVFTFARPVDFYMKMYRLALSLRPGHTMIVVTSTGSPNAFTAALAMGAQDLHVVPYRVPEHQAWHGMQVARDRLFQQYLEEARAEIVTVKPGMTMQSHLQYITADSVDEGVFHDPWEVPVRMESAAWAGLDVVHVPLATVEGLLQAELREQSLQCKVSSVSPGHDGIFTAVHLEEGAEIPVSALMFSKVAFLRQFLGRPGAQKMHDRLAICRGIFHDGEEGAVYAVLAGFAGELMHSESRGVNAASRGASAGPTKPANLKLKFNPRVGFNSGFLTVIVCTHNLAGLAAGTELLLNYGEFFDLSVPFGARQPTLADSLRSGRKGPVDMERAPAARSRGAGRRGAGGRASAKARGRGVGGRAQPQEPTLEADLESLMDEQAQREEEEAVEEQPAPADELGVQAPSADGAGGGVARTVSEEIKKEEPEGETPTAAGSVASTSVWTADSAATAAAGLAGASASVAAPTSACTAASAAAGATASAGGSPARAEDEAPLLPRPPRPVQAGAGGQSVRKGSRVSDEGSAEEAPGEDAAEPAPKRRRTRAGAEEEAVAEEDLTVLAGEVDQLALYQCRDGRILLKAPGGPGKLPGNSVLFHGRAGKVRALRNQKQDHPDWEPAKNPCLPIRAASTTTVVLSRAGREDRVMNLEAAWKEVLREVAGVSMYPFIVPSVTDPAVLDDAAKVTFSLTDTLFYLPPPTGQCPWIDAMLSWQGRSAKIMAVWTVHEDLFGPFRGVALVTTKNVPFNKHTQAFL